MLQYAQDYDESFPLEYWSSVSSSWVPTTNGANGTNGSYFMQSFYPYLNSTAVWTCPDLQQPNYGFGWSPPNQTATYWSSYIANWYIIQRQYTNGTYVPVSQSLMSSPATVIAFAEGPGLGYITATGVWINNFTPAAMNDNFEHVYLNVAAGCTPALDAGGNCQRQNFPHSGGANYLFCDGHVKWMMQGVAGSYTVTSANYWGRSGLTTATGKPDLYNQ